MPKLKSAKYPLQTAALMEDPTPGAPYLFFWNDAYDKLTFSPVLDVGINHSTNSTTIAGFGVTKANQTSDGSAMFRIGLNGNVTDVQILSQSSNVSEANIEPVPFLSMDPSRPIRKVRYDTDGVNKLLSFWGCRVNNNNSTQNAGAYFPNSGSFWTQYETRFNPDSLQSSLSTRIVGAGGSGGDVAQSTNSLGRTAQKYYPVFYNPSTGNLVVMGWGGRLTSPGDFNNNWWGQDYYTPSSVPGARYTSWISGSPSASDTPSNSANKTCQFLGVDASNRCLFFQNDLTTDYNHQVIRYQDSDNTSTTLFNNTTAPTASGTSAGGNRATNFGNYFPKWSSSTFSDETSPGNRAFYVPYFDSSGKFHPMFYQWNTTNDSFTRNTDITMNWGATSQDNVWLVDLTTGTGVNLRYGMQRIIANETWTTTVSGTTTRYLMLMQLHGSGSLYDADEKRRTFPVFSINPAAPKTLTYHSSLIVPTTPKNIIWLNNDKTQLGVIAEANFYMYAFSASVGWVQTTIIPVRFASVGTDSLGRIWALEVGEYGWGAIHAITQTAPVTVSVTSTATSFNYTGQNISSNVIVNAYSVEGTRLAVQVKLVIDGGSMTFAGSNLTTTITTSASADTSVPITITGAGISNIISSVVI